MTEHAQIAERKYCRPHARPFRLRFARVVARQRLRTSRIRKCKTPPRSNIYRGGVLCSVRERTTRELLRPTNRANWQSRVKGQRSTRKKTAQSHSRAWAYLCPFVKSQSCPPKELPSGSNSRLWNDAPYPLRRDKLRPIAAAPGGRRWMVRSN